MSKLCVASSRDHLEQDGSTFFYLADTVWAAFSNLSIEQWARYLAYRKVQGFNAVQISILPISHDASTSPDSDVPFECTAGGQPDFRRLNEAYFGKAERMVAMAVQEGFVPVLGVVWKDYVPETGASRRSPVPTAMPLDAVKSYCEHVARRFGPYDPIFFISGDTSWDSELEPRYYMTALDIVHEICPTALLTMHLATRATVPDAFVEKIDFYMFQSGHGEDQTTPYRWGHRHRQYAVKRPVVNGEPCYEGHGRGRTLTRFSAYDVRKATWQSMLAGAKMGITYGGHGVWSCHQAGMGFVQPDWKFVPYEWEDALRLPGAWDVSYAKWLFEHYRLVELEPVELLKREDPEVVVAADATKNRIALYTPSAYDVTLDMDLEGYRCEAFDLANRRPFAPPVAAGDCSEIRLSAASHDVLLIATRT